MKLTAEQIAAIEDEVSPSMEHMLIVWLDPEARMSAVVLPYEPIVQELVDVAFERGETIDGCGDSLSAAMVGLGEKLIERGEERYPKLFNPQEGDPHG